MIGGVVLAAGSSTRLGRPKQLLDLGGVPMLQHVIDACDASMLDEIVIVLGHGGDTIAAALSLPASARVVTNPDHERGQWTSLRTGLASLSQATSAALVVLGDQPGIRPEMIDRIIAASASSPIVRAVFGDIPGHPVSFARSEWEEISGETGDGEAGDDGEADDGEADDGEAHEADDRQSGEADDGEPDDGEADDGGAGDRAARGYLAANPDRVLEVSLGDEPLPDIDTEDDYESLRASWPRQPHPPNIPS